MPDHHPLRVGVAGLHHDHAWGLLCGLNENPGAELVSAADPYEPLRHRFANDFGKPAHESYEAVLDDDSLDALFIFADNRRTAELGIEAAARGRHLLIEKPLAADLAGAEALTAAVENHQVRLMVNWPYAWWPALREALRRVDRGEIGRVFHLKYRGCHRGPENVGCSSYFCDWLFDPERNGGGGVLMDYCCYGANLAALLFEGEPESVTGIAANLCKPHLAVEDNATLLLRYPNAMATLEGSWSQTGTLTTYQTILYGETGTFIAEPYPGGRLLRATMDHPEGEPVEVPALPPDSAEPVSHFVHALESGEPFTPLCRWEPALAAQRILQRGLEAVR